MGDGMSEELKPCPFCGGEMQFRAALWPSDGDRDSVIHADPSECGIQDFTTDTADKSVIAAWNRRAHLAEQTGAASIGDDANFRMMLSAVALEHQRDQYSAAFIAACQRVYKYIDSRPRQGDQVADWFDFNNMSLITNWLIERGALLTPFTEEKDGDQAAGKNIIASIEAIIAPRAPSDTQGAGSDPTGAAAFKNFHRSLCARFGYTHDEQFWWRDQVSLEEHIAALAQQAPDTVRDGALEEAAHICEMYPHSDIEKQWLSGITGVNRTAVLTCKSGLTGGIGRSNV